MSSAHGPYSLARSLPFGQSAHLIAFSPRHTPVYHFDVLVVGAGVAGAVAAISAANLGSSVALVSKGELSETNTLYAQGGVAAAIGLGDSFDSHIQDTLLVGCGLCDPGVVQNVVQGGPGAVDELLRLGAEFDRSPSGELVLSREGGHRHARILHSRGDATGKEIQRALCSALSSHPRVAVFPGMFVVDLLSSESDGIGGALAMGSTGALVAFSASKVILATGGSGQIYRETTNPVIATGDGVAMALRAGCSVRDVEFIQFHPTCLYIAGAARVLISEIVRGAGGLLRDRHGRRFMPDYHQDAELAPRDIVSRAVFSVMVATNDTSVYLDLSEMAEDPHRLFPGISQICRFFGIDIAKDPVPVRPGAHYQVGGVLVDGKGATEVPGLWAVGECASTGLHGANRMGSNSLLEGVVLGAKCGSAVGSMPCTPSAPVWKSRRDAGLLRPPPGVQVNLEDMIYSLKSLMWRQVGVERNRQGLEDALAKILFWSRAMGDLGLADRRALELVNMLTVARLSTEGALARVESRGVHFRSDAPKSLSEWRVHTMIRPSIQGDRIEALQLWHVSPGSGQSYEE